LAGPAKKSDGDIMKKAVIKTYVTIKDVARLFAGDGITVPQISNAFKWGQTALAGWSAGSEASRQTGPCRQ